MFQCNQCGCALEPDVKHVVLPCLHLYCLTCAQNQLESDSTCVQCGSMFSHKAVKGVNVLQDASKHALTLCGQSPEVIMQSALTAINCYIKQQELMGSLRESKLQRRMEMLHQQCNEKLQQVHTAYTKAKSKGAALAAQLQEANADKEELLSKYQQRSSQVKQLKEQIQAVQQRQQQQHQQHQQQAGVGPGQYNNGMGMLGGGGAGMGGGPRPGRSASPSASPMQGPLQVTTVQRTQLFGNFNSDPGIMNASPSAPMPRPQLPVPGGGGMNVPQRRQSLGNMQHGSMLGGSGGDMVPSGYDMRPMAGMVGSGGRQQQPMQQQQRMGQMGMGMQMGNGGKQSGAGVMHMGHGGGGMMQNSNNINLMGSPSPF